MSPLDHAIRLLVVEDNPTDVLLLEAALAGAPSLGFSLTPVDRLAAALAELRHPEAFDAVLVDLGLPDSRGLETLQSIVAAAPDLPIVVFTSIDDEALGLTAMQQGAEDYLAKGSPSGKEIGRAIRYAIERKRMRTELAHARDAALEAARLKSSFLANMSHEIRTPLNIITGFCALIVEQAQRSSDDQLAENATCITRASARLLETVNGILDLSKIEAGSFSIKPEPIDLGSTLMRLSKEFQPLAEGKGLSLSCAVTAPATIRFDEYCLLHALQNLIQNAIKFTKHGGIELALDRDTDGELRLRIRDTGIGIGESFLPRLFETFSQERMGNARPFEGTGLGLALTRRFLALNGARISVESSAGKGSTFTIAFPTSCELGVTSSPAAKEATPSPSVKAAGGDDAAVLVVEDDPGTQLYMRRLLRGRYRVLLAGSGDEMLARLAEDGEKVKLVLMDISLPGGDDGLALTRRLHQDARWQRLPIVALTAHAMPEDRSRILAAGCDAYVPKPFRSGELFGVMEQLLARPRAQPKGSRP